ncbi:hypothetical protein BCR32DRAFT_274682 [Anaeromyces robustus]|uniref:Uncharacterized protein n=1 Tax=Anaeromyces robustus TaxID=1754192 RepID=A0A1Y1XN95_9FUNG|nr:hypothetical protein BCR32DRAFT_274682 [Anaeromyces robustus]|eukprot:ORX87219.1 hypothetical protein BCR32DRAFT_274682 [Anaeromyces robustus]
MNILYVYLLLHLAVEVYCSSHNHLSLQNPTTNKPIDIKLEEYNETLDYYKNVLFPSTKSIYSNKFNIIEKDIIVILKLYFDEVKDKNDIDESYFENDVTCKLIKIISSNNKNVSNDILLKIVQICNKSVLNLH